MGRTRKAFATVACLLLVFVLWLRLAAQNVAGDLVVNPVVIQIMLMAAGSQAGTAAAAFNLPSSNAPAVVDKSAGGFLGAALDFDDTTDESVQFTTRLPVGFDESDFDLEFTWFGTATSGSVVFDAQSACIGEDEAISDLSFNTEGTVTSAAAAVTLDLQAATISNLDMTNCSDGEHLWLEFRRDVDPTDDFSGDASLWSVKLTARLPK